MTIQHYGTAEQRKRLLTDLVAIASISESEGEKHFPDAVHSLLSQWEYYKTNPSHLYHGGRSGDEPFLSAHYYHSSHAKTLVFISHFDVVGIEDYGEYEPLAFSVDELTEAFARDAQQFSHAVQKDIQSGDYLFGRGTMDMKAGLTVHISLLEKAIANRWPMNIVLVTVPDEEVNSSGMRAAVGYLNHLKDKYKWVYSLFLNSEPVFTQKPDDENYYIYSGSIGKIMPGLLFYGKETHVGEPLAGISSNYMASFLMNHLELNDALREVVGAEKTPLPVSLYQKDLKQEYSVKTPYRTASLFNVFLFKRSANEMFDIFQKEVHVATARLNETYRNLCEREQVEGVGNVQILDYEQLEAHAIKHHGEAKVADWKEEIYTRKDLNDREKSILTTDKLARHCNDLSPAIISFFAPPYYPAVYSEKTDEFMKMIDFIKAESERAHQLPVTNIQYFNGISDLSYVAYRDAGGDGWRAYEANTPVFGTSYTIRFTR